MNYDSMTIDELHAKLREYNATRDAIKAEERALVAVLDAKLARQSVMDKMAALSPAERQVLATAGIVSAEAFGKLGG